MLDMSSSLIFKGTWLSLTVGDLTHDLMMLRSLIQLGTATWMSLGVKAN
jgi:hypothetical protein